MLSVVVLISGTGSNLKALLAAAESPLYPARILAVGADNPAEGLAHAELHGVPTFVVEPQRFPNRESWAKVLQDTIDHFQPDLVVLAGFMRILPREFVAHFSPNLINTHPSLLPLYPGAHAVREALADKAGRTGVTVHVVDEGVDTGRVLVQREVPIWASDNEEVLHERIKQVERELLVKVVREVAEGSLKLGKA